MLTRLHPTRELLLATVALGLLTGCQDQRVVIHNGPDAAPPATTQQLPPEPKATAPVEEPSESDSVLKDESPSQIPATGSDEQQPGAAPAEPAVKPEATPGEAAAPKPKSPVKPPPALKPKGAPSDDRVADKTFDDLKFDIEPGDPFEPEMLTDEIEAMLGQRIRIRGYILPTFQREGITQFILVRDDQECCFGPGAALYDCIVVRMQEGKSTNFSVKPVAVEGRLTLDELVGPDNKHLAIFHLDGESVK
jgi:hypothetical protein